MFSPNDLKKGKNKNKAKQNKAPKDSMKISNFNNNSEAKPKLTQKEQKAKDLEVEKKIDLSVKPPISPSKPNIARSKLGKAHEEEKAAKDSKLSSKRKGNLVDIPSETVSSFYQCDQTYQPKKFVKHNSHGYRDTRYHYQRKDYANEEYEDYGDSQDYSYANSYDLSYYSKMEKSHSVPVQQQEVFESKQFEYENYLYEVLSKEINTEADKIVKEVEMIKDYRLEIKQQIEQVAIDTFAQVHPDVQAHIYGSVATGLALPESDIDIVVTGVSSFGSKENHLSNIVLLYDNIRKSFSGKVLTSSTKILYTQVPILKLRFSLLEYYAEQIKNEKSILPYVDFESWNPVLRELSVDISICDSFETAEHQGIRAAYFVQTNLSAYPVLKPVCLMLK